MKKLTRSLLALLLAVVMVLPNLMGAANAAVADDSIHAINNVQMEAGKVAVAPEGAKWFFDADGETASFGTMNIDVYRNDLPINSAAAKVNNNLTLYSSTDGGIYNLPNYSNKGTGVFSINWESGYYADWSKTNVANAGTTYNTVEDAKAAGVTLFGEGYTDGTYTLVGWGGDFRPGEAKDELTIRFKDNGDGTLSDALSHMTIYLVGPNGAIYDKIWVKSATGTDNGETNCLYTDGQKDADGNYVFRARLHGSHHAQGIKIAFDHTSAQEGNDYTLRHSGTLLVAQVEITCGGQTHDFSPFSYYSAGGSNIKNYLQSPQDVNYLPFIRAKENDTGTADGAVSGANISSQGKYNWHMWTMSTSDANIVHNHTSNIDALQIKYRNDTQNPTGYKAHRTYAELRGSKDLNAHWLVMTLGTATADSEINKMAVVLTDENGAEVKRIFLSELRMGMEADSAYLSSPDIAGQYRTVYYDLTQIQGFEGFYGIRFEFDGVADGKMSNDIRDSRYFYLTQVYLIGEGASIEKTVDKSAAVVGEDLTYTIKVTNNGTIDLNSYTVTDDLPENVSLKSVSLNGSGFMNYSSTEGTLTLNGQNLSVGSAHTYQVTVTVESGTNGSVLENTAVITKLNNEEVSITSNKAISTITANEFVFYAEVGQKTSLPITLSATPNYRTETVTQYATISTTQINTTGNGGSAESSGISTITIPSDTTDKTYELRLTSGNNGGFVFDNIVIGGKTYTLNQANRDSGVFAESSPDTIFYHANNGANGTYDGIGADFRDGLSNFRNAYITLNLDGLTRDQALNVQINLVQSYNNVTFQLSVAEKTTVTTQVPTGTTTPETFVAIPATTSIEGTTVSYDPSAIGANSTTLSYTSTKPGTDTFQIQVSGGKSVTVKVYNFLPRNHLYVLDFGLSAPLTGNVENPVESIISYSGISEQSLTASGADVGVAFKGILAQETKKNNDAVADEVDYCNNGAVYGTVAGDVTRDGYNGKVSIATDAAYQFVYTPTSFLDSADIFYYGVQVSVNGRIKLDSTTATPVMEGKITVIPAASVYYEDNFASSGTGANGNNGIIYGGTFNKVFSTSGGQTDDRTQSNSLNLNYGYDDAYAEDNEFSGGSATELQGGAYALFEFWGTGFDIISHTATDTGALHVYVYSANEVSIGNGGKLVKKGSSVPKPVSAMSVDTYYENNGTDGLYQIPVISKTDLEYGHYIVKLSVSKKIVDNETSARVVEIDGIRIYNPAGVGGTTDKDGSVYDLYTDSGNQIPDETSLAYKEIRALVLGTDAEWVETTQWNEATGKYEVVVEYQVSDNFKAALLDCKSDTGAYAYQSGYTIVEYFTEAYDHSNAPATAPKSTSELLDYATSGPNNELYLGEGYAVAFAVQGDAAALNETVLQIGAKAVQGAPTVQYLNANGTWTTLKTLNTATEMYYELNLIDCYAMNGQKVVILRVAQDSANDNIVSLTKVKIPEALEITLPSDRILFSVSDADQ